MGVEWLGLFHYKNNRERGDFVEDGNFQKQVILLYRLKQIYFYEHFKYNNSINVEVGIKQRLSNIHI